MLHSFFYEHLENGSLEVTNPLKLNDSSVAREFLRMLFQIMFVGLMLREGAFDFKFYNPVQLNQKAV